MESSSSSGAEIWRSFRVYYSSLDRITAECVGPFLLQCDAPLRFMERHYAGGAHLRVRFHGRREAVDDAAGGLVERVRRYMERRPSEPVTNYSQERARFLSEAEESGVTESDLQYRVNQILEAPYERGDRALRTSLLEGFLHDCVPLITALAGAPETKFYRMAGIYLAQAALAGGGLVNGSIAYRAHWEGFAAMTPSRALVQRIRREYDAYRDRLGSLLAEVQDGLDCGHFQDPALDLWSAIIRRRAAIVQRALGQGRGLGFEASSEEQISTRIAALRQNAHESSPFLEALWNDERFFANFSRASRLLRVRVMMNLLYSLVAACGFSLAHRMCLCHFAYRVVEEARRIDLTESLRNVIAFSTTAA